MELINSKDHLTKEGIGKIRIIKSIMNSKRMHTIEHSDRACLDDNNVR